MLACAVRSTSSQQKVCSREQSSHKWLEIFKTMTKIIPSPEEVFLTTLKMSQGQGRVWLRVFSWSLIATQTSLRLAQMIILQIVSVHSLDQVEPFLRWAKDLTSGLVSAIKVYLHKIFAQIRSQFQQHFMSSFFCEQIPKVQKYTDDLTVLKDWRKSFE